MGVSSYRRVMVYSLHERKHIMRDPWFLAPNDQILTEEYSDSDENEIMLEAAEVILDALHSNATAYQLFIKTFLKPKE